jgi:hypothetical protein
MAKNVTTWRDVLEYLQGRSSAELSQTVQVALSHPDLDLPLSLHKGIGIGTCSDWELDKALNADDHQRHDGHIVLLTDEHPFGDDGEIAVDAITGQKIFPKSDHWSGETA